MLQLLNNDSFPHTFLRKLSRLRKYYKINFFLVNILISIALMVVDLFLGTFDSTLGMGLFGGIYSLAVLIPSIAVSLRRLHDTDRSGWWLIIGLIPLIGTIVLLVFMAQDSRPSENRYGSNPKTVFA